MLFWELFDIDQLQGLISVSLYSKTVMNPNIFLKGDFNIDNSWNKPKPSPASRQLSRQKSNKSIGQPSKNIVGDALDDQVAKYVLREFQAEVPPLPEPRSIKSQKKIGKDQNMPPMRPRTNIHGGGNDLLTSMANRLKNVQMTNKSLKEEVKQKNNLIDKLRSENQFLRGMKNDPSEALEKMQKLEKQNSDILKKAQAMQQYLQKYGLKWVGDKLQGKLDQQKLRSAIKKGNYNYRLPSQVDLNTLTRRIQELNANLQAEGRATELYLENGVHKFRKAEPLPIGFFKNGVAIKGYPFYEYKNKEALKILSDLVDGYFPSVLKGKYPDGVFLEVRDRTNEQYDASGENNGERISTFGSQKNDEFKPQSAEEFSNKLPKNVIKNGKVVKIRDQIARKFEGQCIKEAEDEGEQTEVYTKQDGAYIFKTKLKQKLNKQETTEDNLCTLKIRNQKGDVFILHIEGQAKMKEVYIWMQKVVKRKFELMGNYPRRSYDHTEDESLEDLGFSPNGLLHIHLL